MAYSFFYVLKSKFITLLGYLTCVAFVGVAVLSIPIYIYRLVVIFIAKLYRPDLDEILDGQSGMFANDYCDSEKISPRANIVISAILEGHELLEDAQAFVGSIWPMARWKETGELKYKRFQQYPVRFLGFTFWKNGFDTFRIENHIRKLYGMNQIVNDEILAEEMERLLNSPLPRNQGLWEYYVIENYKDKDHQGDHSAIIMKFHHCLSDGYGILTTIMESLFQNTEAITNFVKIGGPQKQDKKSLLQIVRNATNIIPEMAYVLSHQFRSSPWKIPDEKKKWYQICTKSNPIPVQDIKHIKNKFGVSFTSVLFSAISAGMQKCLVETNKINESEGRVLCLAPLPAGGTLVNRQLTNQVTGAFFDVPITKFESPISRLKEMDMILQRAQRSLVPHILHFFMCLLGACPYPVSKLLTRNNFSTIGVSNLPGMPENCHGNGKKYLNSDFVVGSLEGNQGVGIFVMSHKNEIVIGISAERGVMTRVQAKEFLKFVEDEIQVLYLLIAEENKQTLKSSRMPLLKY